MHGDLGTRPHTSESVSELGFYETLERESLQQQDKIYMETRSADEIEETTERLLQELRAEQCPFADLPEKRQTPYSLTRDEMQNCQWLKPSAGSAHRV